MFSLVLTLALIAQDAPAAAPAPMPVYAHRDALAQFRYNTMMLANPCEVEGRNRKLETDVCERFRDAAVGYMRQTADLYVWCAATMREGNFERTIPLDCPIQGDTNLDPVII
ncbi:hypothetical protein [Brevundimonas subvibrioides]|uniref:hypothetical protein n=1 Tax=Brevundimonas subvibrioides TaxID=74313 RepID=UPI0032D5A5CB